MELEISYRRVGLQALRLMAATFIVVIGGLVAAGQVYSWAFQAADSGPGEGEALPTIDPGGPSTVRAPIRALRLTSSSERSSTIGSGFAVGRCVVTNYHVVADSARIVIGWPRSGSQESLETAGSFLAGSVASDLAIVLGGEGPTGNGAVLALGEPAVGDPVTISGYHGGVKLKEIDGVVHAAVDGTAYGIEGPVLLLDKKVSGGMSGGPVLNSSGEVVGVVSRVDDTTDLTIAISIVSLRSHLEEVSGIGSCALAQNLRVD